MNSLFNSPYEWIEFCRYITTENRYVLNKKWSNFFQTILNTAKKREHILLKGGVLYRARIGREETEEYRDDDGDYIINEDPLSPKELGAPPQDKALEGRINPKGISYLYLANTIETAISEIRPWLGQAISVGHFSILKDMLVIDASKDDLKGFYVFGKKDQIKPSEKWEKYIWRDINNSFSKPVNLGEEHKYYVPTQYLSEYFKNAGYGGIVYKSSLTNEGHNFALFQSKDIQLSGAELFDIKSIKYGISKGYNYRPLIEDL